MTKPELQGYGENIIHSKVINHLIVFNQQVINIISGP
jgi:hypothetical protein